jgi:hypothetical protein
VKWRSMVREAVLSVCVGVRRERNYSGFRVYGGRGKGGGMASSVRLERSESNDAVDGGELGSGQAWERWAVAILGSAFLLVMLQDQRSE